MDATLKISIITVNFNGYKDTCELIDSLDKNVSVPYEIIVVDNASNQNEAEMIKSKYSDNRVKVIRSENNLGFAGGNNIGIAMASGDYIMLLNNDTLVENDTLHYLVSRLDENRRIGAVSPKIRFTDNPKNIQFAGYTPLSKITIRNSLIGFNMPDDGSYDTAHTTPFTHGAAMMLRRDVIQNVGSMPEIYFLYYEELDWCEKIAAKGYEMWYEPRCTVFHKESSSTGRNSPLRTKYLTRNRLLFAWRNRYGLTKYLSVAYQLTVALPKSLLTLSMKREFGLCTATVNGCIEFFKLNNKKS